MAKNTHVFWFSTRWFVSRVNCISNAVYLKGFLKSKAVLGIVSRATSEHDSFRGLARLLLACKRAVSPHFPLHWLKFANLRARCLQRRWSRSICCGFQTSTGERVAFERLTLTLALQTLGVSRWVPPRSRNKVGQQSQNSVWLYKMSVGTVLARSTK